MKKLVVIITLFLSAFAAQPALADEPRLMREDMPSYPAALLVDEPQHHEKSHAHSIAPPSIRAPRAILVPPVRYERPCPEVCIQ